MPQELRDQLNAIGKQPKYGAASPMMAEMAKRQIKKRAERERFRNRAGAGLGATLAAGLGLSGISRMGREEEEQQEQRY